MPVYVQYRIIVMRPLAHDCALARGARHIAPRAAARTVVPGGSGWLHSGRHSAAALR